MTVWPGTGGVLLAVAVPVPVGCMGVFVAGILVAVTAGGVRVGVMEAGVLPGGSDVLAGSASVGVAAGRVFVAVACVPVVVAGPAVPCDTDVAAAEVTEVPEVAATASVGFGDRGAPACADVGADGGRGVPGELATACVKVGVEPDGSTATSDAVVMPSSGACSPKNALSERAASIMSGRSGANTGAFLSRL